MHIHTYTHTHTHTTHTHSLPLSRALSSLSLSNDRTIVVLLSSSPASTSQRRLRPLTYSPSPIPSPPATPTLPCTLLGAPFPLLPPPPSPRSHSPSLPRTLSRAPLAAPPRGATSRFVTRLPISSACLHSKSCKFMRAKTRSARLVSSVSDPCPGRKERANERPSPMVCQEHPHPPGGPQESQEPRASRRRTKGTAPN